MFATFSKILFLCCICFIFFISGALMSILQIPPATQLATLYETYTAFQEKTVAMAQAGGEAAAALDLENIFQNASVHNNLTEQAGYNLVVVRYQHNAQLLDMHGKIVYRWNLPFSKAFVKHPHIKNPLPDARVHFRIPHLYPNGDLLVSYEAAGDTPYGYGLVKLDKNSKVIWNYAATVHHNQYVDKENGNIYAVTQQFMRKPIAGFEKLSYPTLADSVVILNAQGQEIDKIFMLDAFKDSGFEHMFDQKTAYAMKWDWSHTNSIMKLEPDIAAQFPLFKAGDILVSLRNIDTIAVIDHLSKKVIWATKGIWKAQHSVSFLNNGHILLFDNRGNVENNGKIIRSRIVELDPSNLAVTWEYSGSDATPLFSFGYGNVQRLDNGNTLITDTLRHRAFEVNARKEKLWEITLPPRYVGADHADLLPNGRPVPDDMFDVSNVSGNPEYVAPNHNLATAIFAVERYQPEQLPFLQETLR